MTESPHMTKRETVDLLVAIMNNRDPELGKVYAERLLSSCTEANGWIIPTNAQHTRPWRRFW